RVRRRQAPGHLPRDVEHLAFGQRSADETIAQRLTYKPFGDDIRLPVGGADVEHREDVRVIELACGTRLDFKAPESIGIAGVLGGQYLQRDVAPEPGVVGEEHFAHTTGARERVDFVRSEASARLQRHARAGLWISRSARRPAEAAARKQVQMDVKY